jgi:ParB-like nuclease family protein
MKRPRQSSLKERQLPDDQPDARNVQGKFTLLPISLLSSHPQNPRKHSRQQIRALARSISKFGFTNPLLVDKAHSVLAGNGRFEAAKLLGLEFVPVIQLDHLSEAQGKALLLADNQLHPEGAVGSRTWFSAGGHRL